MVHSETLNTHLVAVQSSVYHVVPHSGTLSNGNKYWSIVTFRGETQQFLPVDQIVYSTWALFVVLSDIKTREAVTSSRWNWTLITNFVCFSCLMTYEPPILPPTALWATRGAHLPPLDVQFRKQLL